MRILSEPDVLRLIVSSSLPAAERFERWVFEEVLPRIRKTGRFGENTVPTEALNDPATLRQVLLGYTEKVIELEAKVGELAPKAAALDRIARETDGAVCLRVAAKLAQVPEKQYLQFLNGEHWIFRPHHSTVWQGYADKEKAGLIELKRTRVTRDDGSEKTVEQVLVTPRGQAKITELIERKAPWLRKINGSRGESPPAGVAA